MADRIADRFIAFHTAHPEVYREFCAIVKELRDAGHDHYSADGILHVIRFHTALNKQRDGGFKINNDFAALYARKFITEHPWAVSFFALRERKAVSKRRVDWSGVGPMFRAAG